jgi:hypothetical protein
MTASSAVTISTPKDVGEVGHSRVADMCLHVVQTEYIPILRKYNSREAMCGATHHLSHCCVSWLYFSHYTQGCVSCTTGCTLNKFQGL